MEQQCHGTECGGMHHMFPGTTFQDLRLPGQSCLANAPIQHASKGLDITKNFDMTALFGYLGRGREMIKTCLSWLLAIAPLSLALRCGASHPQSTSVTHTFIFQQPGYVIGVQTLEPRSICKPLEILEHHSTISSRVPRHISFYGSKHSGAITL
jgi:hypothetical protein